MKLIADSMPKVVHDDLIKAITICLEEESN
jgi:hypothetical protein